MQEATDRLMCVFQEHASVTVSYQQGGITISNVLATVGRTPFDVVDGEVMLAHESRDYIIKKSDLFVGGVQITPASGDRITEEDGRIYEVSIPKPFFVLENIGPAGSVFKIHTMGPVTYSLIPVPVISSAKTTTAMVGEAFSYQITATNDPTIFGAEDLPDGLAINVVTGLITGIPTTYGQQIFTVTATSSTGTGSQEVTITVAGITIAAYSALLTPPTVPPVELPPNTVTHPQTFEIHYTDADGVNWLLPAGATAWLIMETGQ